MDTGYIRFDWAIKRPLRDKANFAILEGFISVLLGFSVKITEVLESESNQQTIEDKFNRVDLMVKSDNDEIFIVEVQLTRDLHFMKRILYGTSKAITEHIKLGETYKNVKKYTPSTFFTSTLAMARIISTTAKQPSRVASRRTNCKSRRRNLLH